MSFKLGCFFYNAPATTATYTLSLHDALPIFRDRLEAFGHFEVRVSRDGVLVETHNAWNAAEAARWEDVTRRVRPRDRKSTRLNSSHRTISYAVFCLKKKT